MFKTTGPKYEEEQDIYMVSLHRLLLNYKERRNGSFIVKEADITSPK